MTYGNIASSASYAPPVISEVEGVNMPGQAFMREVFSLKKGGTGAAMNQPQTVAYVIRVINFAPPTSVLLAEFESASPDTYAVLGAKRNGRDLPGLDEGVEKGGGVDVGAGPRQAISRTAPGGPSVAGARRRRGRLNLLATPFMASSA